MGKRIVLFIDGTGQDGSDPGKTKSNVWRLFEAAQVGRGPTHDVRDVPVADPGTPQVCHYLNGVATDGDGKWTRRFKAAFGLGTAERIREAYLFLALNYDDGDSVYLFGFSRGAFAVRSLAGFVGLVGVLFKRIAEEHWSSRDMIANAYDLYVNRVTGQRSYMATVLQQIRTLDPERRENLTPDDVPPIPIHFIGVWDTVRMLGTEPFPFDVARYWTNHHDLPELPAHISNARHALAIHESRPEFEPTLWEDWNETATATNKKQTLQQVWFPGDHSDVGGGHDDGDVEHSDVSLEWMALEAGLAGLTYDSTALRLGKHEPSGQVHYMALNDRLRPRTDLSAWRDRSKRRLMQSFRMHKSACDHLLRSSPTAFKPLDEDMEKYKPWRWSIDPSDRELLDDIDGRAAVLHFALSWMHEQSLSGTQADLGDGIRDAGAGDDVELTADLRGALLERSHDRLVGILDRTTRSVLAPLAADASFKVADEGAAEWLTRLGELQTVLCGHSAAHARANSEEVATARGLASVKRKRPPPRVIK